jgi:hypothetical protein
MKKILGKRKRKEKKKNSHSSINNAAHIQRKKSDDRISSS